MLLGGIAAIRQNNIKRLLAYSSIGHVGYILIGLASFNFSGLKGAILYMLIYVFMNIAIFGILLSLKRENKYIEKIDELSGLSKSKPIFSLCIAIIMLSMAGIPPFAGFFGKFYIFISAIDAELFYLAVIGVITSVIAAYYYLRIIKIMYFDETNSSNYQIHIQTKSIFILILSMLIISLFIFYPSLFINLSSEVSNNFFRK